MNSKKSLSTIRRSRSKKSNYSDCGRSNVKDSKHCENLVLNYLNRLKYLHGFSSSTGSNDFSFCTCSRKENCKRLPLRSDSNGSSSSFESTLSYNKKGPTVKSKEAVQIVLSALEYGLASGVLVRRRTQFAFSNFAKPFINDNLTTDISPLKAGGLDTSSSHYNLRVRKSIPSDRNFNSKRLSKNYKLARALHPRSAKLKACRRCQQERIRPLFQDKIRNRHILTHNPEQLEVMRNTEANSIVKSNNHIPYSSHETNNNLKNFSDVLYYNKKSKSCKQIPKDNN